MQDPALPSPSALRASFDRLADLPDDAREASIAALGLSDEQANRLRSMFAFDALLAFSEDARAQVALAMDLSEPVRLKVQEMLRVDGQTADVQRSLAASAMEALQTDDESLSQTLINTTIGSFRLTELLGEGGSSTVFRAEREAGSGLQTVALKVLRTGIYSADARRRFRREQAILAQLTHPNIARFVEGGVSSLGIPYIAMELVDGTPITRAAEDRLLGIAERLDWFRKLCRTIEAAHAALIVHRDLKPDNLLITRGDDLRVLDFGIARLLDVDNEATRTKAIALTPEYAAPEQFGPGPVTTAVDVYSLGIVLGELLTGRRPLDGLLASSSLHGPEATGRAIPRGLPPRQMLARSLRGDLDAMVAKAIVTDPAQRYSSAGAFADDVERFLSGMPVRARAPSRRYRARKFLGRHRKGAILTAVLSFAMLSTCAIALWQAQVARRESARANFVRDFVLGIFESARSSLPRDQRPTPESLVAQAAAQLENADDLDAATGADLHGSLGEVWLSLSSYAAADREFDRALTLSRSSGNWEAQAHLEVLRADGWQRAGRSAESARVLEPLLPRLRTRPSRVLVRALGTLAAAEVALGKPDRAVQHQREAAALMTQLSGEGSIDAIAAKFEVGIALAATGAFAETIDVIEPLLMKWRALRAPYDERYVRALGALLKATDALGRYADAEARVREMIEIKRSIYPAPHDSIARSLRDQAHMLFRKGGAENHTGAERLIGEALAMQRAVLGDDHIDVVETLESQGLVYSAQRKFVEAERSYLSAIATCRRIHAHEVDCARVHNNLGQTYYLQDRYVEAEREMLAALSIRRAHFGESHPSVAVSMSTLANVAAIQGDTARAMDLAARAVAMLEQAGHGQSRETALARNGYADVLHRAGRPDSALREIDRAITGWRRVNPDERVRRVLMLSLKGQILKALKRHEDVQRIVSEIMQVDLPPGTLNPLALRRLEEIEAYAMNRAQLNQ